MSLDLCIPNYFSRNQRPASWTLARFSWVRVIYAMAYLITRGWPTFLHAFVGNLYESDFPEKGGKCIVDVYYDLPGECVGMPYMKSWNWLYVRVRQYQWQPYGAKKNERCTSTWSRRTMLTPPEAPMIFHGVMPTNIKKIFSNTYNVWSEPSKHLKCLIWTLILIYEPLHKVNTLHLGSYTALHAVSWYRCMSFIVG